MKLWNKSAMLTLILAGTLSMSGFAFDLSKDATEWTANPDCMVTMYLGMPQKEFENNFSGLPDWKYKRWNNMNVLYPSNLREYERAETSSISKNIYQKELIHATFREDTDALHSYDTQYIIYQKKLNNNYKKEILPAMEQGRKIYKSIMDNMVKKYGPPTHPGQLKKSLNPNGEIYAENILNGWTIGKEHYSVYMGLLNSRKDFQKPDYCPIVVIWASHDYKS